MSSATRTPGTVTHNVSHRQSQRVVLVAPRFDTLRDVAKPKPDRDLLTHIGLRLRAARLAEGIPSEEKLGEIIGASRSAVGNWEQGTRMPDPMALTRFWLRLGITLEWIYAGELRGMPWEKAEMIREHAESLGACIGAPKPDWPMAAERTGRPAPTVGSPSRTIHAPPPPPLKPPRPHSDT